MGFSKAVSLPCPSEGREIYFLGILGAGMSALARLAADLGFRVSGADSRADGATLSDISVYGEDAPLPDGVSLLVYTLAAPASHPLLLEAARRRIPCLSRPAFLALLEGRFPIRIAVSGMHGKSTTVGMCAAILTQAGYAPTVLAGASLGEHGGYVKGEGKILLYEACEYRDAFLSLAPTHTLILNTEWEHVDYFEDEEAVLASFRRFATGASVTWAIAPARSPLDLADALTFGDGGTYEARALGERQGRYSFSLSYRGRSLCRIRLAVLGRFQVENALAAAALCHSLGVSPEAIEKGLAHFHGVGGRMEYIGRLGRSSLFLDYAHHPTELAAAIEAAGRVAPRVCCVFEAHTYSRAYAFRARYASVLRRAARVGLLPIFAAREQEISLVSGAMMAADACGLYLPDYEAAATCLCEWGREEESVLLLVGAGGVPRVIDVLKKRNVLN